MRPNAAKLALVSIVLALQVSCASQDKLQDEKAMPPADKIVAIGCIGSTDDATRQTVKRLLEDKGMWVGFSGSGVYYVLVDKQSAQVAQDYLKASGELKGKWIQYYNLKNAFPETLDVKSLAEALLKVDPWPDRSTNYSEANWKALVSIAKLIQRSDPRTVSEALQKYQTEQVSNSVQEIHNDSKLYLLMRVVFELPEHASNDANWSSFGCWLTMKTEYNNDGTINRAWPIAWNHGNPCLVSGCLGIQGFGRYGRYGAADEFLYFRSKCAFRDLSSFK